MPLVNNKVGADGTAGNDNPVEDGKALVDSLIKVVACYRQLASCVGSCTDSLQLRDDLRQTRERAQSLATACCQHLTSRLRDKGLPDAERKEMELLWVAFSCGLELLHADLCKVYSMGGVFSLANTAAFVQTGVEGGSGEVTARALSLTDLSRSAALPEALESQERGAMEREMARMDELMAGMEAKVNVLRWTVEPRGPQHGEPLSSTDSSSFAPLPADEERPGPGAPRDQSKILMLLLLCAVVLAVAALSICVLMLS